jgi:hypothetical protein
VIRGGLCDQLAGLRDFGLGGGDPSSSRNAPAMAHERGSGQRGANELDADLNVRGTNTRWEPGVHGPARRTVEQRAQVTTVDDAAAVQVLWARIGFEHGPVLIGLDQTKAKVSGERPKSGAVLLVR